MKYFLKHRCILNKKYVCIETDWSRSKYLFSPVSLLLFFRSPDAGWCLALGALLFFVVYIFKRFCDRLFGEQYRRKSATIETPLPHLYRLVTVSWTNISDSVVVRPAYDSISMSDGVRRALAVFSACKLR